jgi:3-polyprenyl-4-hydroxybenzoate decarboxylase
MNRLGTGSDLPRAYALSYSVAILVSLRSHRALIDRQHSSILHHDLAVDYYGFNIGSFRRVHELRVDVVKRRLVNTVHSNDYQVGAFTGFERPWPQEIRMSEEVKKRIDHLWPKMGL